MNLPYFTEEAYKRLQDDLNNLTEKYIQTEPWLENYFGEMNFYKESSISVPKFDLISTKNKLSDEDKCLQDIANVKIMYVNYKDYLSTQQASNPFMWTALSHLYFKEYIVNRWQKDNEELNVEKRFFATSGRQSLLYYNALSRLWWCGYITYDEANKKTNPYHLTEILLSAQQLYKDFTDTSYSMNKEIAKGVLLALKEIKEENTNKSILECFREFNKYLNRYGAVTTLDYLTSEEIKALTLEYMKKWFLKNK